jgi:hypothetical protein
MTGNKHTRKVTTSRCERGCDGPEKGRNARQVQTWHDVEDALNGHEAASRARITALGASLRLTEATLAGWCCRLPPLERACDLGEQQSENATDAISSRRVSQHDVKESMGPRPPSIGGWRSAEASHIPRVLSRRAGRARPAAQALARRSDARRRARHTLAAHGRHSPPPRARCGARQHADAEWPTPPRERHATFEGTLAPATANGNALAVDGLDGDVPMRPRPGDVRISGAAALGGIRHR